MLKTLIHKQLRELFAFLMRSGNKKKDSKSNTSTGRLIFMLVAFAYLFFVLSSFVVSVCDSMIGILIPLKLDWVYFSVVSILSTAFGVIGGVFTAYRGIFKAKDNEMLISMPIKPRLIVVSRMVSLYFITFIFELVILAPAFFVYAKNVGFSAVLLIFWLVLLLAIPILALAISCFLGWIIAVVSTKLGNSTAVVTIVSLLAFGLYFYFFSRLTSLVQSFLDSVASISVGVKKYLYPFYAIGQAGVGNAVYFIISLVVLTAIFLLILFILSKSFVKIAISNKTKKLASQKKQIDMDKSVKAGNSLSMALFKKEVTRFVTSSTYMLNCGLGVVLLLIGAGAILFYRERIVLLVSSFEGYHDYVCVFVALAVIMIASINNMSAPSVSLEGGSIWVLQSAPVPPYKALMAKVNMQLCFAGIPTLILLVALVYVLQLGLINSILLCLISIVYTVFNALWGIVMNLKMPNMNWTNEVIVIKQSAPVFIVLFGGWGIAIGLGILYIFALRLFVSPIVMLIALIVIFSVISIIMFRWMRTRGARIFSYL